MSEPRQVPYYVYPGLPASAREQVIDRFTTSKGITLDVIARIVEEEFHISLERMQSKSRKHEIVKARTAFCSIARGLTGITYQRLGNYLNRDHATILFMVRKNSDWIRTYPEYKKHYGLAFGKCSLSIIDGDENKLDDFGY